MTVNCLTFVVAPPCPGMRQLLDLLVIVVVVVVVVVVHVDDWRGLSWTIF